MKHPARQKPPVSTAKGAKLRGRAAAKLARAGILPEHQPMLTELYRRAQARLREQTKSHHPGTAVTHPAGDDKRLFHELQVHQIELEMQNAELRQVRDELEASLENYTDLYDFAPVGYFTLTATGTIRQVNLTGAHLVQIDRSRLVGLVFGLLVAAGRRPAFNSFLKNVFAGQAGLSVDIDLQAKPGRPPQVVRLRAQLSPTGLDCRAAVVDITELKREEDKVRFSEIRYRRLFEAAHDGVLLLDPATRKITDANPFMTKLLGYPHAQLVGKELFEIGLLKDEAASRAMFERLKKNRQVRYENLPLESRGGRHQEVEVVANLYGENGQPVIQCNIRDITVRKQAEDILRRNEAMFAALVQQAPMGVYVVDARFRLQQVNPTARPVFKNVRPLIGRDLAEIYPIVWPKHVAAQVVRRFRHTLKTGEPYQAPEFAERRQDTGVEEIYEWQIQRVTLPGGEYGVVCFFNNITERRQAESAQRRLRVVNARNHGSFLRAIATDVSPNGASAVLAAYRTQRLVQPASMKPPHQTSAQQRRQSEVC